MAAGTFAAAAHADATLDKIHQRHKLVVGVVLSGGPFGSIDPATQRAVGFNVDLAQALGRGLGVEVETVQVQPSIASSSCSKGASMCSSPRWS